MGLNVLCKELGLGAYVFFEQRCLGAHVFFPFLVEGCRRGTKFLAEVVPNVVHYFGCDGVCCSSE